MNLYYKLTLKELKSITIFNTLSRDITYNTFVYINNIKIFLSTTSHNKNFDFTFNENNIIDNTLNKTIPYSEIRDLQVFDNIIFLITDTSYIFTIPKRIFIKKENFIEFSNLINKNIEKQSIDGAFSKSFNSNSTVKANLNTSLIYKDNINNFLDKTPLYLEDYTIEKRKNILKKFLFSAMLLFLIKLFIIVVDSSTPFDINVISLSQNINLVVLLILIIYTFYNSKSFLNYKAKKKLLRVDNPFKELSLDNEYFSYKSDLENFKLPISNIVSSTQRINYTVYTFKTDDVNTKSIIINKLNYPILLVKNFDALFKIHESNNNLAINYKEDIKLQKFKIKLLKIVIIIIGFIAILI